MRKVFISSATLASERIFGFEEYRQTAKRAVEIMGDRPVISKKQCTFLHIAKTRGQASTVRNKMPQKSDEMKITNTGSGLVF